MSIKKQYHALQKASQTHLGWQWLLPLLPADVHHLESLNIPETDEQCDFDGLVLSLAKILIDSLNEESLKKMIPYGKRETLKDKSGIALLKQNHRAAADAIFQEMIGMAESDRTDASVNHDDVIYELETKL